MNNKIDFVIMWVNGNDLNWIKEKNKYLPKDKKIDARDSRYRDWNNLKYWFRGVEKFAPWVNNIFFITCGQIPEWLNINNPKLKIIKHEDYIPKKYLPTFNSHPIELNLHRIKELSEYFVLFNDDMFIINKTKPTDFFVNGVPCDSAILSPIIPYSKDGFSKILSNEVSIINTYFNKNECLKKYRKKWFSLKYEKYLLRTICMLPWKHFTGFYDTHIPTSLTKTTMNEVWKKEFDILDCSSMSKFRNNSSDVNHWLFRYWNLCKGNFYPRKINFGYKFQYEENNSNIYKSIEKQKYKVICINDTDYNFDFQLEKVKTINAFEKILPYKSNYEI